MWDNILNLYKSSDSIPNLNEEYYNIIKQKENYYSSQIDKDLPRTRHIYKDNTTISFFKNKIRNVLLAYSNFNTTIGYIQGMNMIASGIFINICDNLEEYNEFKVFKIFYYIIEVYNFKQVYGKGMNYIFELVKVLNKKIKELNIDLYNKLNNGFCDCVLLFSSFYFSLFNENLQSEACHYIFDLYFLCIIISWS